MVLLNGVKYACERCIRGHRVSSCSHTNKPLMMIKPKGRPASQCTHCREQRKIKNAHVSCNCGKKGKSPGQHLASCPCHKNSHCTCSSSCKEKKSGLSGPKKNSSPEVTASDSGDASQSDAVMEIVGESASQKTQPSATMADQNLLIEDIALPFEAESGLLDYFSSSKPLRYETTEELYSDNGQLSVNSDHRPSHMLRSGSSDSSQSRTQYNTESFASNGQGTFTERSRKGHTSYQGDSEQSSQFQRSRSMNYFPNPPSDADLDLMENMFPLFPLVGFNSFDEAKALPLSGLPEEKVQSSDAQKSQDTYGRVLSGMGSSELTAVPCNRGDSIHQLESSTHANLHSDNQSAISLQNMDGVTHPPRPLNSSSSFNGAPQMNRPKRSESVISAASTSSTTSKQNLFDTPQFGQLQFPKSSTSAAFPPYNLSNNNSNDDFHRLSFNSPVLFNENKSLPILGDEELSKNGPLSGNNTPQSSMPSRQISLTRRKASISRSHSLHNNMTPKTPKEHAFFPMKAGSSAEMSPRQGSGRRFGSFDHSVNVNDLDMYLREVAEESSSVHANDESSANDILGMCRTTEPTVDFSLEHSEFSSIPMYQQLFEPVQNTM